MTNDGKPDTDDHLFRAMLYGTSIIVIDPLSNTLAHAGRVTEEALDAIRRHMISKSVESRDNVLNPPPKYLDMKVDARFSPWSVAPTHEVHVSEGYYGQCLNLGILSIYEVRRLTGVILYREDAVTLARAILERWDTKPEGKQDHD